jgi:hypothetical protein
MHNRHSRFSISSLPGSTASMPALRVGYAGVILGSVLAGWTTFRAIAAAPERPAVVALVNPGSVRGAGSCSATACHGSIAPIPASSVLRNEHTTWASRDKHAKAYQVLYSARSRTIAENLGRNIPAHRDTRCLACHATPGTASAPEAFLEDGVGCESCHGPAERWLSEHTSVAWRRYDGQTKFTAFGMAPLHDVTSRAATCATCHVGAPGRDVDHDLIAAGHPRLNFEFTAYADLMPRHWVETGANTLPDAPARAWAIGQVVSAKAALDLLHDRAERARSDSSRWPEFAEYECFACHHDLRDNPAIRADLRPGLPLVWGTWYYPMMATLAGQSPSAAHGTIKNTLDEIRTAMSPGDPSPREVALKSNQAADALRQWLTDLQRERFDPEHVQSLISRIQPKRLGEPTRTDTGWDIEAQRYLALVPLRQSIQLQDPSRVVISREEISKLVEHLRFPAGYDSPRPPGVSRAR